METLKFKIIKDKEQYSKYCDVLENLIALEDDSVQDEIDLLTLLIEKWDSENNTLNDKNPIEILKFLMSENNLNATDLTKILGLSKGTVSKILNYHKGLSKETIRKLADHFMVSQETFNRPYRLRSEINKNFRNASLMNTRKNMNKKIEA